MSVAHDTVVELFEAALSADYTGLRRIGNLIARDLAKAGNLDAAHRLRALLRKREVPLRTAGYVEAVPVDAKSRLPLVEEQSWPSGPVFLDETALHTFETFLSDARHVEHLRSKGLASRLCMLLYGRPGTGKSVLAGHIAARLDRPFFVARLDTMISSLLGDTAKNIRGVFDFVPQRGAVLFLDEMDAIAKKRDDRNELGELKRVVNTVIQGLDALDESTVVVAATNHPHLLDAAIWRRFPYEIEMKMPETKTREDMWKFFLYEDTHVDEDTVAILAILSEKISGADIETIALAARRHAALTGNEVNPGTVALAVSQTRNDKLTLPQRNPLGTNQKRDFARMTKKKFNIASSDIARILGVTRQAIHGYRKGI